MLQMIWDSLAPIALMALLLGSVLAWRNWPKLRRVQRVLRRLPAEVQAEVQAAWAGRPSPRSSQLPLPPPVREQAPPAADAPPVTVPLRLDRVPGAGRALLNPPNLQHTLQYMQQCDPEGRYLIPYGWFVRQSSTGVVSADLAFADLSETYNIGVIGPQQYGKTSMVYAAFMALTFQRSPRELQFAIFDLKDIDFSQMEDSTYTQLMVRRADQIADGVKALQKEIERRGEFLRSLKISNWKNYTGKDLPLLLVYISELSTMAAALGLPVVDKFLNDLMGRGAAFGIRTIVDTHSLSGYSTLWRNLLSDRLLGPGLSNPQHDQVNGDLSTAAILAAGAVPPSQLRKTHLGVFTATTDGGHAITLRMVYVPDTIRQVWLDRLPKKFVLESEELVEREPVHELADEQPSLPQPILAGRAAELYQQGVEIGVILSQPHVRTELKDLAAVVRHAKTDTPNVRQITARLFGVDEPSGTQQPLVKAALIEMGLIREQKPSPDLQPVERGEHALAA